MPLSFTRRLNRTLGVDNSGDIVDAAHINELQVALEGITTGTQPIPLAGIAGALGEYGPLSDVLSLQIDPRMYVDDWSGAADKAPYIQDALNDAAAVLPASEGSSGGAQVVLPKEDSVIRSQLVVPKLATLVGRGTGATRLTAHDDFEDDFLIRLGPGNEEFEAGCSIRDLTLGCEALPGVGGIYSSSWQEPAFAERVRIRNYRGYAVHLQGDDMVAVPSHGIFRGCEFFAAPELDFDVSILLENGGNTHIFEQCTVAGMETDQIVGSTALRIINANAVVIGGHFERHETAMHPTLGAGNRGGLVVLSATSHPTVENLLRITDNVSVVALNLRPFGATNSVNNEATGETITTTVGFYANRPTRTPARPRSITQTSSTITLTSTNDIVEVDSSAGSVSITLPAPASNPGVEFTVKHVGSANSVALNPVFSDTIDGAETKTITTPGGFLTVYSNGTEYKVIASGGTIT